MTVQIRKRRKIIEENYGMIDYDSDKQEHYKNG